MTILDVASGVDPHGRYAALREVPPQRCEASGLWLLSRHADVQRALAMPALRIRPSGAREAPWLAGGPAAGLFRQHVRMSDGRPHGDRRRRLAAGLRVLAPAAALAPIAGAQVRARLGCWPAKSTFDAMTGLAEPLPAACIARWLGLQGREVDRAAALALSFAPALLPWSEPARVRAAQVAAADLIALLEPHAAACRLPFFRTLRDPALPGRPLSQAEAVANAVGLLAQSCDAMAGLLGLTLLTVLRDPSLMPVLRNGGDAAEALLCEVMRFDPPIHNTRRVAARDLRIGGAAIGAGDGVLLLLAAAGRDPAAYSEPDRFVAGRFGVGAPPPPPPAFGAGGHRCPGTAAALAIAGGALSALLSLRPSLALADPTIAWRPAPNARIPQHLYLA